MVNNILLYANDLLKGVGAYGYKALSSSPLGNML